MTDDRASRPDEDAVEDLDVDPGEAADVKGGDAAKPTGKVHPHDFTFTHLFDKSSP
jgi:type VI protein secretion system component Hcp